MSDMAVPDHAAFRLDPRLAADCHRLGRLDACELLLVDNALVPWLILVPRVTETELHHLDRGARTALDAALARVSAFVATLPGVEKLNVAAIGNVVRQLHVHVVGRHAGDVYWPGVVWGDPRREPYAAAPLAELHAAAAAILGEGYTASE